MKTWTIVAILIGGVLLSSAPAIAQTEFSREQAVITLGSNTLTVDDSVQYVFYTAGTTFPVTLNYSATCNIVFSGLTLHLPNAFTPRGVNGTLTLVGGTPTTPGTGGSVTFDLDYTALKHTPVKDFGVAHLTLVLGVDEDCNPATGDSSGLDGAVNIGVAISVSTARHP